MTDWYAVLVQIPIVAVFIWFSERMYKSFAEALNRRDEMYELRNAALVKAIEASTQTIARMCESIGTHDAWTHEALDDPSKTRPRNRRAGDQA